MATATVGQTIPLSLDFKDIHGAEMQNAPTLDAPPAWSVSSATLTLTPSDDGVTCAAMCVSVGSDDVTVSVSISGEAFTAVVTVTVDPAVQKVGSVSIVEGTPA